MSRTEQRSKDRINQKFTKSINNLTPNQLKLVDALADYKTDELIEVFKSVIDTEMFKAMRSNGVSIERANKIMKQANESILAEIDMKKS